MVFEEVLIIIALSIIQSIAGVGILLVGTPILLAMGYDFIVILSILVLPSFAVSIVNVIKYYKDLNFDIEMLYLPLGVFAGLYLTLYIPITITLYVCGVLLITLGILALSSYSNSRIFNSIKIRLSERRIFYPLISLVHGFSNLGGGFLVWRSLGAYSEKNKIRAMTALIYAILAASQLFAIKIVYNKDIKIFDNFLLPIVAAIVFISCDKYIIKLTDMKYRKSMYYLIITLGILILVKTWWQQ
jgi:uncharacterized membrane protein YfcA